MAQLTEEDGVKFLVELRKRFEEVAERRGVRFLEGVYDLMCEFKEFAQGPPDSALDARREAYRNALKSLTGAKGRVVRADVLGFSRTLGKIYKKLRPFLGKSKMQDKVDAEALAHYASGHLREGIPPLMSVSSFAKEVLGFRGKKAAVAKRVVRRLEEAIQAGFPRPVPMPNLLPKKGEFLGRQPKVKKPKGNAAALDTGFDPLLARTIRPSQSRGGAGKGKTRRLSPDEQIDVTELLRTLTKVRPVTLEDIRASLCVLEAERKPKKIRSVWPRPKNT